MVEIKNVLRLENYGIPIGSDQWDVCQPYGNRMLKWNPEPYEYRFQYKWVEPNSHPNLNIQQGDIIKISRHLDKPRYAQGQYGVIIDRYVREKYKGTTYRDHCFVIMLISGPNKGHAFRFPASKGGKIEKTVF